MVAGSERLRSLLDGKTPHQYITPLFWQHGESQEVLREEIAQMASVGVNGFILEARPFPEFLKDAWWETVEFVLREAKSRQLKVYVFDDIKFPSGFAAGKIRDLHPEYLKRYLREDHLDTVGPLPGAAFRLQPRLRDQEQLVRVIAVPVSADGAHFEIAAARDLTPVITSDNLLYWDVPSGRHRLFFFIRTRDGGERHTQDYLTPLLPEAVRAYIDAVYEPHYQHFAAYFGNTFAGFFSDEPRFGSAESYTATLGSQPPMSIPFSDCLLEQLSAAWNGDFSTLLPCLWYDGGKLTARARFVYMDTVSRLYGQNYTRQIGDWCRSHGVKSIGHLVEDNGAHTRLGYGAGHFFRASRGWDWAGMDIVLFQLLPEYSSGQCQTPFGLYDSDFYYWGLTKLASSESHLDRAKQGTTFCEAFGAYGWSEGLKLMKWLTNHVCARGVNHFVPHAFSPAAFPDPDCPPHFYARGHNPQWRYFVSWSAYAERLCHLLSDGLPRPSVAVLYHAEAEWTGGAYDPFEKVIKVLAQRQIDSNVVPIDTLLDPTTTIPTADGLRILDLNYAALIIPWAECLPESLLVKLNELGNAGIRILFLRELPQRGLVNDARATELLQALRNNPHIAVIQYENVVEQLIAAGCYDVLVETEEDTLRCYHYARPNEDVYFLLNESTVRSVDTVVRFRQSAPPLIYNPTDNMRFQPFIRPSSDTGSGIDIAIELEPGEAVFAIFSAETANIAKTLPPLPQRKQMVTMAKIAGPWKIGLATAEAFPVFSPASRLTGLGNVSGPDRMPGFSGTIRYETEFESPLLQDIRAFLDLGRVYEIADVSLNGNSLDVRIAPPYRWEITGKLRPGHNCLQVDITNTLAQSCGDNPFDGSVALEPSGLIGPVLLLALNYK